MVVLGGSKVSDKLAVIEACCRKVDRLLIGGGMCFTFLKAQGHEVGKSLLEEDKLDQVRGFLAEAAKRGVEIVLPVDVVAATEFAADAEHDVVAADAIPADRLGLDIGPEPASCSPTQLADARTVFWNGPMGVFEFAPFAAGTRGVAEAITKVDGVHRRRRRRLGRGGARARPGRGRLRAHLHRRRRVSLEYLEGKTLPGLAALED